MEKIQRTSVPAMVEELVTRLYQIQTALKELGVDEMLREQQQIKDKLKALLEDGTYILQNNLIVSVMSQQYREYVVPAGVRKLIKVEKV